MYKYLHFTLNRELRDLVIDKFRSAGIRYFPEATGGIVIAREIVYGTEILSTDLDSKIDAVRDSVVMGFNHAPRDTHSAVHNIRKRESDVSQSEFMLLYYAFYKDPDILDQRLKLYNDLRYPFKYYCSINRVKTGTRTLLSKLSNGVDYDELLGNFNISNFQIVHLVLFLNLNGRSFTNPEAIKSAEELLNFANNRETPCRSVNFYKSLYDNQRNFSNDKDIYIRVFSGSFEAAQQLLTAERQLVMQERLKSTPRRQVHLIETPDDYIEDYYNLNIYSSAFSSSHNNYYMSSPRSTSYNQNALSEVEIISYEDEGTVIQISSALENIDLSASNITREECLQLELSTREVEGIFYNPAVLSELDETSHITSMHSTALKSSEDTIPGILSFNSDSSCSIGSPNPIKENCIEYCIIQQNPFYKITNYRFQMTDDGQELIKLLKSKAKRNYIVLEMAKLQIKERGYEFSQAVEFFSMMETHGYILRKPKEQYFIFKFTNKFHF